MRILIIGHTGQLGTDLVKEFEGEELVLPENLDIRDHKKTFNTILTAAPDFVISTAAYHNTRKCEDNPKKAFDTNSFASKNLAEACKEADAPLIWFSSDMVFGGTKGDYIETDYPHPVNVYGLSKYMGERFIELATDAHYIIRTDALFGKRGCEAKGGGNFVELMLRLAREGKEVKVKDDEFANPTYAPYLAEAVRRLIGGRRKFGVYHIAGKHMSWHRFAEIIFEEAGVDASPKAVSRDEFSGEIRRGRDTSLRIENEWRLPVREGARKYLEETGHR